MVLSTADAEDVVQDAWLRLARSDWWAMATSISTTAPTTVAKTPMSNSSAVAAGTWPTKGTST